MVRRPLAVALALAGVALAASLSPHAGLKSVTVPFVKDEWIEVPLKQEGIRVVSYRISLGTSVSMNPLKVGAGPSMYFNVKNEGTTPTDFGLAVALYDKEDNLVGATSGSHVGKLAPGESKEMKVIFRDVNQKVPDAATVRVAVETRL